MDKLSISHLARRAIRFRRVMIILLLAAATTTLFLAVNETAAESDVYFDTDGFLHSAVKQATLGEGCRHFIEAALEPGKNNMDATVSQNPAKKTDAAIPTLVHFLYYNQQFTYPRYLCAVESAARQNPNHHIIVWAANPAEFNLATNTWQLNSQLVAAGRVSVRQLDWPLMMTGTPLEAWFTSGAYKESKWVDQNLGNAFRLAVVYQQGGVYLDMDIISMNPLSDSMGRSLGMQDKDAMNNAFLRFPAADPFLWASMEEFVSGFNGNVWGKNGPEVITRTYKKRCRSKPPSDFCTGVNIAPVQRFYPFGYKQKQNMFEPWEDQCEVMQSMADELSPSIGIHWWNRRVKSIETMSNRTVLAVVMKAHCPALFSAYTEQQLGMNPSASFGAPALLVEDPELMKPKASKK
ncbi:Lactosylceramide 4-alpha-galactosyltransferase [Chytriomyces hyalinus]|nr:Lactosylceramide 4-alpha-galactosyltransferase [Chytriomyces hyalinus]